MPKEFKAPVALLLEVLLDPFDNTLVNGLGDGYEEFDFVPVEFVNSSMSTPVTVCLVVAFALVMLQECEVDAEMRGKILRAALDLLVRDEHRVPEAIQEVAALFREWNGKDALLQIYFDRKPGERDDVYQYLWESVAGDDDGEDIPDRPPPVTPEPVDTETLSLFAV